MPRLSTPIRQTDRRATINQLPDDLVASICQLIHIIHNAPIASETRDVVDTSIFDLVRETIDIASTDSDLGKAYENFKRVDDLVRKMCAPGTSEEQSLEEPPTRRSAIDRLPTVLIDSLNQLLLDVHNAELIPELRQIMEPDIADVIQKTINYAQLDGNDFHEVQENVDHLSRIFREICADSFQNQKAHFRRQMRIRSEIQQNEEELVEEDAPPPERAAASGQDKKKKKKNKGKKRK